MDKKEQSFPGSLTWCCAVHPKDRFKVFHPLLPVIFQAFEGPSLEPLEDLGIGVFGLAVALRVMR